MADREGSRHETLSREGAADPYRGEHAEFDLMPVRVPWNAGVPQADGEPVSLLIPEHERLVGDPAVAGNAFERIAQGLRGRHDVVEQADLAQIEIAGHREAETVVLQGNRGGVQEQNLAPHAQSLLRLVDQLGGQSGAPEKRRHRQAGAPDARDGQAGEGALCGRDRSQVPSGGRR